MMDGAEHCLVNRTTGKVSGFHAWNLVRLFHAQLDRPHACL
jgi:hypothetical protein